MQQPRISFRELSVGINPLFKVFYIIENGRSQVIDSFKKLPADSQDEIKVLIKKMATIRNFGSDKIRWRLQSKYTYGELKPRGHRFFFFIKFGNNIIFFKYSEKKKDSLGDSFYKRLETEKKRYEAEFEKSL
jgi:hypothetical protein